MLRNRAAASSSMSQRNRAVGSSSMGPRAELTPPSSHHPDNASPTSPFRYPEPDTPPATNMDHDIQPIACMYIPNCDTGSTLRKAISHIFGRNKMCTRLVPQHIWVHYCRKHYQRSRYRNPKEYAKLQCDLVQKQIRAIRDWSLANQQKGTEGIVKDWGLTVRKREQKRLDDLGSASRKRTAHTAFDGDSEGEGEDEGAPVPATAVPQWLLELCGKGYSTEVILDIFSRLHQEILENAMDCFPDIEILPNIVVDRPEPKGYSKRVAAGAHKRSQSLGVGMKSNYNSADRRMSQLSVSDQDNDPRGIYSPKRQRPNSFKVMTPESAAWQRNLAIEDHEQRLFERPLERPIESGRRAHQLAHRPVFPHIDEHQAHDYQRGTASPMYSQPLPAPAPQRIGSQSMADLLETHDEEPYAARRSSHQRSYSDMSSTRGYQSYTPPHSTMQSTREERHESMDQQNLSSREEETGLLNFPERRPVLYVPRPAPYGHSRHQSTPVAQQTYLPQPVHGLGESRVSSNYGHGQNANTLPPISRPRSIESPRARALYSTRR